MNIKRSRVALSTCAGVSGPRIGRCVMGRTAGFLIRNRDITMKVITGVPGLMLLAVFLGFIGRSRQKHPESETAAVEASMIWLTTVDAGQYAASWNDTAEYFKMSVRRRSGKSSWVPFAPRWGSGSSGR